MIKIWEMYPKLIQAVLMTHRELAMDGTGHPFDHTLQVAQVAANIAENHDVARLAGAAGLCHNADRCLQKKKNSRRMHSEALVRAKDIHSEETIALVNQWLKMSGEFSKHEHEPDRILIAVLGHNGPNLDDSDAVLVALQDADRVVCSMPDTIMYAAQFLPLPPLDPQWLDNDPDPQVTSYDNPKSVLRNLRCREEWRDETSDFFVRLPKAKDMMRRHVVFIDEYIETIKKERANIGLWPDYPKF